jgi:DNA-binding FadR family transcriptional regulator
VRAGPETIAALEAAIADAAGRDPSGDEFRLADARFHQIIAVTSGNDLLVTFTSWILDVLQPSLIERIGSVLDGAAVIGQHEDILRAIRRGQRLAAERAMLEHIKQMEAVLRSVDAAEQLE